MFFVLLPMIGGSIIGQAVVKTGGETFMDEISGQMQYIPNQNIFLVGGLVCLLAIIPFALTLRKKKS